MIDGDGRNPDVLSGPWPHQDPEYADAKSSLHSSLRSVREAMLSKLEGLSESRAEIVGCYRRAWAHADATIDALALDSPGRVPWWTSPPSVPLFNILVRVLEETNRHVGHADILREQLDGPARIATDNPNLPNHDAAWWENYRARVERAATAARPDEAP